VGQLRRGVGTRVVSVPSLDLDCPVAQGGRQRSPTSTGIVAVASLADLEARVAALEADRADYRAVLAAMGALPARVSDAKVKIDAHRDAIDALGETVAGFQAEMRERFDTLDPNHEQDRGEAAAFRRSVEDGQAELKDLVLQTLDRRRGQ
jgi:hypothetical protein